MNLAVFTGPETGAYVMQGVMPARYRTVIDAYAAMGRPGMSPYHPDIEWWADQNASARTIWEGAATFIDDPQWHDVAAKAIALLNPPIEPIEPIEPIITAAPLAPIVVTTAAAPAVLPNQRTIMPTAQALQTAVDAYVQMGHPDPSPTNPDVISWAESGASKVDIWAGASTFINDPQWHNVAAKAIELLSATPGATVSPAAQTRITAYWANLGIDPSKSRDSFIDTIQKTIAGMSPLALAAAAAVALLILRR